MSGAGGGVDGRPLEMKVDAESSVRRMAQCHGGRDLHQDMDITEPFRTTSAEHLPSPAFRYMHAELPCTQLSYTRP